MGRSVTLRQAHCERGCFCLGSCIVLKSLILLYERRKSSHWSFEEWVGDVILPFFKGELEGILTFPFLVLLTQFLECRSSHSHSEKDTWIQKFHEFVIIVSSNYLRSTAMIS